MPRFRRSIVASSLACALAFVAAPDALAQSTGAPPPPPGGGSPTASSGAAAPNPANGAAEPEAPKGPVTPAAGYSFSDKPTRTATATATRPSMRRQAGPSVNQPGFEPLAGGGSRLFVTLSQSVPVEERRAQGTITYVLKGAHARVWNNTNALVTVHFNTPVWRARLVPQGNDLHFVIELRANAAPTFKMADRGDKTAILTVDFAKGDYGTEGDSEAALRAPLPGAAPRGAPAPGRRGGRGRAPDANPPSTPAPQPAPPSNGPTP